MGTSNANGKQTVLRLKRTIELPFVPHDIALGTDGSVFAVENGAPRIHKFDSAGNPVASWGSAGSQAGQFSFKPPPNAPPLDGGFVVVGADANVYVSDSYNNRVQIFDSGGKYLSMWKGYGADNKPFNNPGPISVDAQGNIYVADFAGVHKFDRTGKYLDTFKAAGEIALDSRGNLFAAVAFEGIALKMPAGGGEPKMWGGEGKEDGKFIVPMWLVVDSEDTVYISDHSGRVQLFDSDGNFVAVWSDPANGDPPLRAPSALAMDAQGNLYVASKDRRTVYVLETGN